MAPPLCIHLRTDQPTNHPPRNRRRRRRRHRRRLTPAANPLPSPPPRPAQPSVRGSPSAVAVKAPRVGKGFSALYLFNWTTKRHFPLAQSEPTSTAYPLSPLVFLPHFPASSRTPRLKRRQQRNFTERIPPRIECRFVRIHEDAAHCAIISLQWTSSSPATCVFQVSVEFDLPYNVSVSREHWSFFACVHGWTFTSFPSISSTLLISSQVFRQFFWSRNIYH